MHAHTLSFRAEDDFVEKTRSLATFFGFKNSEYIRDAVREKNERMMAERIAMLSRKLSEKHHEFNKSMDDTLNDGIA